MVYSANGHTSENIDLPIDHFSDPVGAVGSILCLCVWTIIIFKREAHFDLLGQVQRSSLSVNVCKMKNISFIGYVDARLRLHV